MVALALYAAAEELIMKLNIEVGSKYVITGTKFDLVLNEKRIIKDGKNAGQETLVRLSY